MKKLLSITICLLAVFSSTGYAQKQTGRRAKSKKTFAVKKVKSVKSEVYSCSIGPSVTDIELSQKEIVIDCPAADTGCSNNKIIKVKTVGVDREGIEEKYVYWVSAGKIIGEGYDVEWDLSNVAPGSYTITAGISQYYSDFNRWDVYGQTQTRTVIIR